MIKFKHRPTDSNRITSPFGARGGGFHNGIDIGALTQGVPGDKLYAVADGTVVISKVNNGGITKGFGNYVVIEHGEFCTLYGHIQALEVKVGQLVKAGEVTGHMGSTGKCSGVHLHLEVREGAYIQRTFWERDVNGKNLNGLNPKAYFLEAFKLQEEEDIPKWKNDGERWMEQQGIVKSPHNPLETVDFGTLGTILMNFYDFLNKQERKIEK